MIHQICLNAETKYLLLEALALLLQRTLTRSQRMQVLALAAQIDQLPVPSAAPEGHPQENQPYAKQSITTRRPC